MTGSTEGRGSGENSAGRENSKEDPAGIHSKVKRMRMERTGVTAGVGGRGQMCPRIRPGEQCPTSGFLEVGQRQEPLTAALSSGPGSIFLGSPHLCSTKEQ